MAPGLLSPLDDVDKRKRFFTIYSKPIYMYLFNTDQCECILAGQKQIGVRNLSFWRGAYDPLKKINGADLKR